MNKSVGRIEHTFKLMQYVKGMWKYLVLSTFTNVLYKVLPIALSAVISYMIGLTAIGEIHNVWIKHLIIYISHFKIFFSKKHEARI